jgi:hypothetical protein
MCIDCAKRKRYIQPAETDNYDVKCSRHKFLKLCHDISSLFRWPLSSHAFNIFFFNEHTPSSLFLLLFTILCPFEEPYKLVSFNSLHLSLTFGATNEYECQIHERTSCAVIIHGHWHVACATAKRKGTKTYGWGMDNGTTVHSVAERNPIDYQRLMQKGVFFPVCDARWNVDKSKKI